ncbi:MAG: hypothetical protein WBB76_03040 [Gaiellaceae bacterium]
MRAVPATAASIGTKVERRRIAKTVAMSIAASKRSNPAQAMSQWSVMCFEGRVALR